MNTLAARDTRGLFGWSSSTVPWRDLQVKALQWDVTVFSLTPWRHVLVFVERLRQVLRLLLDVRLELHLHLRLGLLWQRARGAVSQCAFDHSRRRFHRSARGGGRRRRESGALAGLHPGIRARPRPVRTRAARFELDVKRRNCVTQRKPLMRAAPLRDKVIARNSLCTGQKCEISWVTAAGTIRA